MFISVFVGCLMCQPFFATVKLEKYCDSTCFVTSHLKKKHLPSAQFTVSEPGEGIVHKIHCKAEADNEVPGQSNMFKR